MQTEELNSLLDLVKGLPTQFPKLTELPPTLVETLRAVAKAGETMDLVAKNWETQRQAAAEAAQETPGHPAPTPELIESWRNCEDCAPGWQKIWDGIAASAREGYVPTEEAQSAITEVARQLTGAKKGV